MWTALELPSIFLIISFNYNRFNHFRSFDCTIMTEKSICRHIPDVSISKNDVCNGSGLDLSDDFRWISWLVPKSISISDFLELVSSNCSSQLSIHRSRKLILTQHSNVCVNVVNWVITFFDDKSIHFVLNDLFKCLKAL